MLAGGIEAALLQAHKERRDRFFPVPPPSVIQSRPSVGATQKPIDTRLIVAYWAKRINQHQRDINSSGNRRPSMDMIRATVARRYGYTVTELIGPIKTAKLVRPRQIAIYLCTRLTLCSLPAIGKKFNRDHTTAIHSRDQIAVLRLTDASLNAEIEELEAALK